MKLIFTILIILCTLFTATNTIAGEGNIGRYQVVGISPNDIFLVDTVIGMVWALSKKEIGGGIEGIWVPTKFMKGFPMPGDNALWVTKEEFLRDSRLNTQDSVLNTQDSAYEKAWKSIIENKKQP